ncbi:STAS domain-containing protein [Vibrio vulnificus]|uniref:STAS domain-containing protein n=1 Tax=Vibrio vulnificus TaxID=672 RepID=UPI000CD0FD6C|nr:STAS domain-containing protein [Vibrio vulnificus]EGQ7696659.1 STAS domain-containing protein [Vibrio vulnificus]EGQ7953952.1 STAS domain-containing protein [Vibrio vulnificus]EGQ7985521.1 STAS domain-containing protein [Vibrio vulnificus]EGQ9235899.1 STAS domain-containing protein [Vibrio vulnificus]EGQ9329724.1 STAS domain-containing protein [Vibrio vulnificus]
MECWLAECLDISSVQECRAQYLQWLESDQPLQLIGSEVRKVDASGIQALVSFIRSVKQTGSTLELTAFSEVLAEGIELLGYELN